MACFFGSGNKPLQVEQIKKTFGPCSTLQMRPTIIKTEKNSRVTPGKAINDIMIIIFKVGDK